jgi:hypothetical protein
LTCTTKPRAKDTSRGFKRTVAVPEGRKKNVLFECREGFRGGRQRATSTTEVQGGGWGYGAGGFKFWWEGRGCEPRRNKKSGGHQTRETQTLTKIKRTKKKKDPNLKKKRKKVTLVVAGLDLTAFLKGPEGCPLDHRCVMIRTIHTNFDLLSIHIGSSSNIQPTQMDKKRVLQRVLRYYHCSTLFG